MSNTVQSLFTFLDQTDQKELKRGIPKSSDIENSLKSQKRDLKHQIKEIQNRINEFEAIKNATYQQKENYTSEISQLQGKIESIMKDKENLVKDIRQMSSKLVEIEPTDTINENEEVAKLVKQGLKDLKKQLDEELNKQLHTIMSNQAKRAAEEFSPHIQQLKTKHWANLSVLQTQHTKELEKIKQRKFEDTKNYLNEFREKFREQTVQLTNTSLAENNNTITRYRQKCEKEVSLINADFSSIKRNIENAINEVKRRTQRDIEIERNAMMRRIEDCKRSVNASKRTAEQRLQQLSNLKADNNFVMENLPVVELEKKLNDKNNVIINNRKEELSKEIENLQEEVAANENAEISQRKQVNDRKISKISDDIEYLSSEKKHLLTLLERMESHRVRAEKRKEVSDDEIIHLSKEVSSLKDRLFSASTIQPEYEINHDKSSERVISAIKKEINQIRLDEMRMEKEFNSKMSILKDKHESALKKTGDKIKQLITAKDKEIEELSEQLNKANKMLIAATSSMK